MKNQLQNLLSKGKTDQVIKYLVDITDKIGEESLNQEVIVVSAKYKRVNNARRMGTIRSEEYDISLAQVNRALAQIIGELPTDIKLPVEIKEEDAKSPIVLGEVKKAQPVWNFLNRTNIIISSLAGITAILLYFNFAPDTDKVSA